MKRERVVLSLEGQLQGRLHGTYRLLMLMMRAALILAGLTGCADDEGVAAERQVLKVLDSNELSFNMYYGDYVNAAFPNVEIEVVPSAGIMDYKKSPEERLKRMKALIEEGKPDLILIQDQDMYEALANEGLLDDLSFFLSKDKTLASHIYPGILEEMKRNRDGLLYGLSPDWRPQLLYYNEDLFRDLGIEPPSGAMTWAEMLQLAQRVTLSDTSDKGVIGFLPNLPGAGGLASLMALTEGFDIYPYRLSLGMMTANTPSWQHIYKTAIDSYRTGTFGSIGTEDISKQPLASEGDQGQTDLFTQGRAGMVLGSYGAYEDVSFKLGATAPLVDEATRSRSYGVSSGFTMSIRAGSSLSKLSWDIIAFVMGDYASKVRAGLDKGWNDQRLVPSNMTYMETVRDPFVKSVYEQLPAYLPSDGDLKLSSEAYQEIAGMLNREIADQLMDKQTFDQMIERMQEQGQQILDRELKKE